MLDLLSVTLPSFSEILALGGIFFVLIYAYAASDAADAVSFKYDSLLQARMNQLKISSWQDLATKAHLTRYKLRMIRRGEGGQLPLSQLGQLAIALDWKLEDCLSHLQILSATSSDKDRGESEELRQQCLRLRDELQQQKIQLNQDFQDTTFEQLQPLLTNYPSARKLAEFKPDLPAKNLMALFTALDNLLDNWGLEKIGLPWEQVPYNPQIHQPDVSDMIEGEQVYIRFVGYRDQKRILCPAKVSRTLPSGIKN